MPPRDSDIFKDLSAGDQPAKGDAEIFVDLEQPAEAQAAPVSAPKATNSRLTPEQEAAYKAVMGSGAWGSGVPKLAYELGGKITDLTGMPSLGAVVNVIPDALQAMLGGNIAAAGTKPVTEWAAKTLMGSALKPTLDQVKKGKAAPAIETMLKDGQGGLFSMPGYNPTPGGVEKMKSTLGDLGDKVKQEIANSGAMISTSDVADFAAKAYPRFANGPLAKSAIDDLGKVQQEFIDHPSVMGAREIPIQQAQDMKRGYQSAVGDKGYDQLKTPATEGEKQIARGLRELIGQARPSVLEPLARESNVINALKMAERRVAIDANKNPIGLGWLGQPWMIPFWMWDRSALAKGVTARALYSGNYPALGGAGATSYGALYRPEE
jgi:hypothetical protein